jgi:hypothetical protein
VGYEVRWSVGPVVVLVVSCGGSSIIGVGEQSEASGGAPAGGGGQAGSFAGQPAAGSAGAAGSASLDEACTPAVTVEQEDVGETGDLFLQAAAGDPEGLVQSTSRTICHILYRNPEEARLTTDVTLIVRFDPDSPGWTSVSDAGPVLMVSTDHLSNMRDAGADVGVELRGVLFHLLSLVYQHHDEGPGEATYSGLATVISGIADSVRIRAGYPPPNVQPDKAGTWDAAGFQSLAFFLLWIDNGRPDFIRDLNQTLRGGDGVAWTPAAFESVTGRTVDDLWLEYQSAECCVVDDWSCCR